jgi:hypothetical protein
MPGVTIIIPSTNLVCVAFTKVLTSKKYVPGLRLDVFAAFIVRVISPFAASVMVQTRFAAAFCDNRDFLRELVTTYPETF